MARLKDFLRTGELGPIVLGMSTREAIGALGEPEDVSRKSNPVLLRYGPLELIFWRGPKEEAQRLRDIVISYDRSTDPLPKRIAFADWSTPQPPTREDLLAFAREHDLVPMYVGIGVDGAEEIAYPSGVVASVLRDKLRSLRLIKKEVSQQPAMTVSEQEQTAGEQILNMLKEADLAFDAGARRAALLIAWAGVEATLRHVALRSKLQGKVGVQPAILIQELRAARAISAQDAQILEGMRQVRMAYAHGLPEASIDRFVLTSLKGVTTRLLAGLA